MFLFANLIQALAVIIDYLLWIYMWIVIARAILSWVNPDPYNPIVRFLRYAG
jgi:YggT family protein